jgi:arylsulfatase A-like enzyme/Tfp pilus assembly protein PilF
MGTSARTSRKGAPPSSAGSRSAWSALAVAAWTALVILAVSVVVYYWPGGSQADLHRIPGQNVLLVTIDTLRADALGTDGGPASTPVLDRLAAQGVRFDFAHAHAVLTLPSHASIMTGEYPHQHGVRDNSGYRLPRDARTIATALKQASYATAAFVGAFPVHSRFGLNAGFDVYDDDVGEERGLSEFNTPERPASTVVSLARDWLASRTGRADVAGGEPQRQDGGEQGTKPWFVWVHLYEPHAPYQPPPPFDAQYAGRLYYGEVAAADAALAPLLEDLRNSDRPALVIVTGDHGEALGDHGEEAHGIFAYESTLRVPLIIANLGGPAAASRPAGLGEVSQVAARHVDILPTILDAVGRPVPSGVPGRTLLPRQERRPGAAPRASYFEAMSGMLNYGWAPLAGVLVDRDKLIDLPVAERYDLANDPAERSNVFGRLPERDRTLVATLSGFAPALPGQRAAEDPETAASLRALGYVSGEAPAKVKYTEADDPKRLIGLDAEIHHAFEAFGAGRSEEAAQICRQVIERRPDMEAAYRHLAFIDYQRGEIAGAIDALRRAVAAGVTSARVRTQLGEYLSDAGQIAESVRILEPLATDPAANADVLNALGIAYARAARSEDARRMFERLAGVMPRSSGPLENLGVLALGQGDAAGASQYFDRAIAISPNSSRAHAGSGAAAFERGDREAAYASWARAVELDPNNADALFSLGVNLARDGRMDAARPYLDRFLRTAPPARYADQLRAVSRLLQANR